MKKITAIKCVVRVNGKPETAMTFVPDEKGYIQIGSSGEYEKDGDEAIVPGHRLIIKQSGIQPDHAYLAICGGVSVEIRLAHPEAKIKVNSKKVNGTLAVRHQNMINFGNGIQMQVFFNPGEDYSEKLEFVPVTEPNLDDWEEEVRGEGPNDDEVNYVGDIGSGAIGSGGGPFVGAEPGEEVGGMFEPVDASVPVEEFEPLDEGVRADMDFIKESARRLYERWTSPKPLDWYLPEELQELAYTWRANLTIHEVEVCLGIISSIIRGVTLDASVRGRVQEKAFVKDAKKSPTLTVRPIKGSELESETEDDGEFLLGPANFAQRISLESDMNPEFIEFPWRALVASVDSEPIELAHMSLIPCLKADTIDITLRQTVRPDIFEEADQEGCSDCDSCGCDGAAAEEDEGLDPMAQIAESLGEMIGAQMLSGKRPDLGSMFGKVRAAVESGEPIDLMSLAASTMGVDPGKLETPSASARQDKPEDEKVASEDPAEPSQEALMQKLQKLLQDNPELKDLLSESARKVNEGEPMPLSELVQKMKDEVAKKEASGKAATAQDEPRLTVDEILNRAFGEDPKGIMASAKRFAQEHFASIIEEAIKEGKLKPMSPEMLAEGLRRMKEDTRKKKATEKKLTKADRINLIERRIKRIIFFSIAGGVVISISVILGILSLKAELDELKKSE